MTAKQMIASSHAAEDLSHVFWKAADNPRTRTGPAGVVQHALACVKAFDEQTVRSDDGKQIQLMSLIAEKALQEDLTYASPEMARGETFDQRALVFAIGVLIFERLTDRHPFGASHNVRVARIRRGEMGSGVNYFPSVPRNLREILIRAMGPFPEERYTSLESMTVDLQRFVDSSPLSESILEDSVSTPRVETRATGNDKARQQTADGLPKVGVTDSLFDDTDDGEMTAVRRVPDQIEVQSRPQLLPTPTLVKSDDSTHADAVSPTSKDVSTKTHEETDGSKAREAVKQEARPDVSPERPRTSAEMAKARLAGTLDSGVPEPVGVGQVYRSGMLKRFAPLMYMAIGSGATALVFLVSGGSPSRSLDNSKIPSTLPTGAGLSHKAQPTSHTTALQAARSESSQISQPDAASVRLSPSSAIASSSGANADSDGGAKNSEGDRSAASAEVVESRHPVMEAGHRLAQVLRRCRVSTPGRGLRVAVFVEPGGKIKRGFLASGPSSKRKKCFREAVRGLKVSVEMPESDYLEWRVKLKADGQEDLFLTRPKELRKIVNL